MTYFGEVLPANDRGAARKFLAERSGEWQRRFFRHEILLARTVHGMQIEAQQEFARTVVQPLLKSVAGTIGTFTPRGSDLIPELFPEIASLHREVARVVHDGAGAVQKLTEQRLGEIARQEVRWTVETARKLDPEFGATLDKNFGAGVDAKIEQRALARPWLGDSTERWFDKMLATPTADNVRAWVNTGIAQGLTTDEIVRGLRGTTEQTGILSDKPSYAIAALVRTAATHASSVARHESFKALGAPSYRWVSTLDEKTCPVCGGNEGQTFLIGKGPVPPAHPNCRCSTVPAYGDELDDEVVGSRASVTGPVPASTTWADWIDEQSPDTQDEVFGATVGAAYRAGKLTLKQMVGSDLLPLTVAELREMDRI